MRRAWSLALCAVLPGCHVVLPYQAAWEGQDGGVSLGDARKVGVSDGAKSLLPVESGLLLWLDASQTDSLVVSDSHVTSWRDMSGLGYDTFQAAANEQPEVASGAINGLDAVLFDGVNDFLEADNPSGAFDTSEIAIFAVVEPLWKARADTPENPMIVGVRGEDATRISLHIGADLQSFLVWNHIDNVYAVTPLAADTPYALGYQVAGGVAEGYLDGESISSEPFNVGTDFRLPVRVGQASTAFEQFYGHIAEVIVYGRGLNGSEVGEIFAYLTKKWGL